MDKSYQFVYSHEFNKDKTKYLVTQFVDGQIPKTSKILEAIAAKIPIVSFECKLRIIYRGFEQKLWERHRFICSEVISQGKKCL